MYQVKKPVGAKPSESHKDYPKEHFPEGVHCPSNETKAHVAAEKLHAEALKEEVKTHKKAEKHSEKQEKKVEEVPLAEKPNKIDKASKKEKKTKDAPKPEYRPKTAPVDTPNPVESD